MVEFLLMAFQNDRVALERDYLKSFYYGGAPLRNQLILNFILFMALSVFYLNKFNKY